MTCRFLGGLFGVALLCLAASAARAENALPPDKAASVLRAIAEGAGGIKAMRGEFVQRKWLPELPAPILARGRVSFCVPDRLRWEYLAPAASGFVLAGNSSAGWTNAGGKSRSFPLRARSRAEEAARLVISCLAFNEAALKKHCLVDVLPAADFPELFASAEEGTGEYVVRLTPKNDLVRAYVTGIVLAFTPDGRRPLAIAFSGAGGGRNVIHFKQLLTDSAVPDDPEQLERLLAPGPLPEANAWVDDEAAVPGSTGSRLFSAMVTSGNGRRLPLLLLIIPGPGDPAALADTGAPPTSLRAVVMTETLFRLGSLDVTGGGVTLGATVPDSQAKPLVTRIGTALGRIFLAAPEGSPAARIVSTPQGPRREARAEKDGNILWTLSPGGGGGAAAGTWRYAEESWSLRLVKLH